jgi:sirohydrochlorin cobaltochelatase
VRAVLLIGYGSVLPGIGTSMIRLASRISAAGIAPIAAAGFIAGCRPTFAEALESCIACGATDVVVQPYALVEDTPIRRDLRKLVLSGREAHPSALLRITRPFGDHSAIAQVAMQRAMEVDYAWAHGMQHLPLHNAHEHNVPRPPALRIAHAPESPAAPADEWRPLAEQHPTGLLLVTQGSQNPGWDWPISAAAEWLRLHSRFAAVGVAFSERGRPGVAAAVDQMAARGLRHLIVVPFMLQLTAQDTERLLALAGEGEARHPGMTVLVADHLNYDRRLLTAIRDRVADAASPQRARLPW